MLRSVLLFVTAVLVALTAGRAFWVWLGENPFDMTGATYVEFFQQLDRKIAFPIAITGVAGTLLAGISAVAHRKHPQVFYWLVAAFCFGSISVLVTVLVNVPLNEQIATWNSVALPAGYEEVLRQWWNWHIVRVITTCGAMCSVFVALLARGTEAKPRYTA